MNHTTTASAPTASHTPGPWFVHTTPHGVRHILDTKCPTLATAPITTFNGTAYWSLAETTANARLIAAAPAMLAALRALVHPIASDEDVDHARAVIAAATASAQT